MAGLWALDCLVLAGILACGVLVVRLKNLNGATMALSGIGTLMTLMFVLLGAPDDAHAEVVVGAITLPVLFLLAIGKTRTDVRDVGDLGEVATGLTIAVFAVLSMRHDWAPDEADPVAQPDRYQDRGQEGQSQNRDCPDRRRP